MFVLISRDDFVDEELIFTFPSFSIGEVAQHFKPLLPSSEDPGSGLGPHIATHNLL